MPFRLRLIAFAVLASLAFAPSAVSSQDLSFDAYMQLVAAKARAQGVREPAINTVLAGLQPNQRVIALDRDNTTSPNGAGFPPLAPYLSSHNTSARVAGGRRVYQQLGPLAVQVQQRYGVPAPIVLAIWGHETSYGAVQGNFDLAQALATLAWEGRRRALFETELIDLMKMVQQGVPRSRLVGSWAGAFGNPQFLPSIYLRLAVDADGDGLRNIWDSRADTLYSIANYFRDAGWRQGQPWGVRASVPASLDRAALQNPLRPPNCPRVHVRHSKWKTVREWRALGVIPQATIGDSVMASLFEPDGPSAPAYLLTQNYRVILEYNCSNYYAMSVGLLADEIAR
uniref:lytic murein transglycosylase n=1 Tax=Altererythrobacter segetis TaxID=1104773 RepID=UPI001408FFAC|nr:lytic murein transglycosylase [Altererythrobacter segetis]